MPKNLATLVRLIILASFALAGCAGNSPPTEPIASNPTATTARITPADPVSSATEAPVPSTPTSTTPPEPTVSPTPLPTALATPEAIGLKDLDRLTPIYRLDHAPNKVTAISFSPDSSILATASDDGLVHVWNTADGKLIYTLTGHAEPVNSLAFTPDGKLLASASDDRTVQLWWIQDGSLSRIIDTSLIGKALKVEFSRDGRQIAIAGNLCYIILRDVNTGIYRRTLKQPHCLALTGGQVSYWGMAFSPDEITLFAGEGQPGGSGGSIQKWTYESSLPPELLRGYDLVLRDLSLSPDGATLAVALSGSSEIWLLDALDGALIDQLEGHTYRVNAVRFSSDGLLLASAGRDSTVRLWDPASGELLVTLNEHTAAVNVIAFSADGSLLASGSDDGTVIVWGLAPP